MYRVRLTPMEAYHFATENNFWIKEREIKASVPYYVTSDYVPNQTSIIGMLRYLILKQHGKLGNAATLSERTDLIGPASFNYQSDHPQDFGLLQSVSAVYIADTSGKTYIPKPANLRVLETGDKLYYQIQQNQAGDYHIAEFSSKDFDSGGYICLEDTTVRDDLFHVKVKSRVNKMQRYTNNNSNDDEGFFKVEMVKLARNHVFEFFVTFSEDFVPQSDIVYLGSYQAAFSIDFEAVSETAMKEFFTNIKEVLGKLGSELYYYAFSDVYVADKDVSEFTYSISSKRHFRNLKTSYDDNNRRYNSSHHGQLYTAGSVFYSEQAPFFNASLEKIGLNKIIKIGE